MAKCKKCGAPIIWLRTPAQKFMPVNPELVEYKQDDDGEDWVVNDLGETIKCTFEFESLATGKAYIPHWATCPYSEEFHRRKNYAMNEVV